MKKRFITYTIGAVIVLLAGGSAHIAWRAVASKPAVRTIAACAADDVAKLSCFEERILAVIREDGLAAGLALVARLYEADREFAEQCHANMHEVGKEAYALFSSGRDIVLSPEVAYCGFGFYHGFLEALIFAEGDPERAGDFCRDMDVTNRERVSTSCFHGIGHGVVDGTDPRDWGNRESFIAPGVRICKDIARSDDEERNCLSGVFNSLAILYHQPKYQLNPDPTDPYAYCRTLPEGDRAMKKACYDQMNTYALSTQETLEKGLALIARTVEGPYIGNAINGLASLMGREALAGRVTLVELRAACGALREDLAKRCIQSLVAGLFEFGKPEEEYAIAAQFCADTPHFADACAAGFTDALGGMYTLPLRERACRYLGKVTEMRFAAECLSAMRARANAASGTSAVPPS